MTPTRSHPIPAIMAAGLITVAITTGGCQRSYAPPPRPPTNPAAADVLEDALKAYAQLRRDDVEGEDRRQGLGRVAGLLERALQHDGSVAAAHARLGRILLELGEFDRARACFQRADAAAAGDWAAAHIGMADVILLGSGSSPSESQRADIIKNLDNARIALKNTAAGGAATAASPGSRNSGSLNAQLARDALWRDNHRADGGGAVDFERTQLQCDIEFRLATLAAGPRGVNHEAFRRSRPSYWPAVAGAVREASERKDFGLVFDLLDPYLRRTGEAGSRPGKDKYPLLSHRRDLLIPWGDAAFESYRASVNARRPAADYAIAAASAYGTIADVHKDDPIPCLRLAALSYLTLRADEGLHPGSPAPDMSPVRSMLAEFGRRMGSYSGTDRDRLLADAAALQAQVEPAQGGAP